MAKNRNRKQEKKESQPKKAAEGNPKLTGPNRPST